MYWSPNVLAVVFKNQEISLQLMLHNYHLIVFLVLTTGVTQGHRQYNHLIEGVRLSIRV